MAEPRRIASRQHPFVRRCRDAAARRDRDELVLLDGAHLLREALAAGLTIDGVLTGDPAHELTSELARKDVPCYIGTRAVLEAASPVRTSSGLVALARWAPASVGEVLAQPTPLIVGLVDVQDPGNVGSVIRSAHALGGSGVLALGSSSDPAGWKALRGAMGSSFHLPVGQGAIAGALEAARVQRVTVAAAVARGGQSIEAVTAPAALLLLVGNEGAGLPDDLVTAADLRVTIPMRGTAESLNVAVGAALCLWELGRGRATRLPGRHA